jgi:hypothetical protein
MTTNDTYTYGKIITNLPEVPIKFIEQYKNFYLDEQIVQDNYNTDVENAKGYNWKYQWYDGSEVSRLDGLIKYKTYRPIRMNDGQLIRDMTYNRIKLSEEFIEWFKTEIFEEPLHHYTIQSFHNGMMHSHTDGTRGDFILSYLIESGGENIKTHWWKENSKPIVREKSLHIMNFQNLEKLHEIEFSLNQWNLVDSRIIHSVDYTEIRRTAFCIAFTKPTIRKFLDKFNIKFDYE